MASKFFMIQTEVLKQIKDMIKAVKALMISDKSVINKIYLIRGQKVMLDSELAELYGTETKVLKQAVKRNISRFPDDFMFKLTPEEFEFLRSQFVTSNAETQAG